VPGDDFIVVADQHRIGEAEPLNAVGDLADLLPGVRAGVLRKRAGEGAAARSSYCSMTTVQCARRVLACICTSASPTLTSASFVF
jgi:hypothetical protein